jgi:hypothetical protein
MIRRNTFLGIAVGCLTLLPAAGVASEWPACQVGQSVAQSSSVTPAYNEREASRLFQRMRADAVAARMDANRLETDQSNHMIDWHVHAMHLSNIRDDIKDMDRAVCRLETITPVARTSEQTNTEQAALLIHDLSVNTNDAISFMEQHRRTLWVPVYRTYTRNIYMEARQLAKSLKTAA